MATAIRKVYDNVVRSRTVVRDANRFRQIVTVLVRHGLGAFVGRLGIREKWMSGVLRRDGEEAAQAHALPLPKRVLRAIQELGPTFVKLGQILSTRPDLVPPEFVEELKTLQDRVPPFPYEQVRQQIQAQLEKPAEEIFERFDQEALASASIAQVHRARLKTGEEVVVKVQRPGIRAQIEADVEILAFLARQLELNFPETKLFSPLGIVREFEKAITKEIDFRIELDHLERFRRNFEGFEGVRFPAPWKDLTTREVLVMEFMDGIKITGILGRTEYDQRKVVKIGFALVFKMIYEDGFIHADLHPGNLFVMPDSTLGLIDCGLIGILTPRQKDNLSRLIINLVQQDYRGMCRLLWKMGIHHHPSEYFETFEADASQIMQKWFSFKNMSEIDFGAFFKDLVDGALRHQIIMPPDYTMTFKAIVTMEGIAKQLCPDVNLIDEARPHVTRMLADRYSPARLAQEFWEEARHVGQSILSLPEKVGQTLDELRQARARVTVEVAETRRALEAYQLASNRLQLAILEAALLLCGTLTLDYPEPRLFGLPGLPVVFYGLAGFLALGHFLGILRSGGT
ncbi:MAG: AarF/ABC1/UbiB kinase family protein [Bdellovibrionota bacterium]